MIRVGLFGLAMSLTVLLGRWLVPAMIVHALVDIGMADVAIAVHGERAA